MKLLNYILGGAGFFLLWGTAGALDNDNITGSQAIIQSIIGVGLLMIPAACKLRKGVSE